MFPLGADLMQNCSGSVNSTYCTSGLKICELEFVSYHNLGSIAVNTSLPHLLK